MKIALCGYTGKTGREVYEVLLENNYKIIGVDEDSKPLSQIINKVDLIIDFTNKTQAMKHINICLDNNKSFIVGTTGFTSDELAYIKCACKVKRVKGVICYNFSMPLNYILNGFNFFNNYFTDMNYLDIHHISKVDKVSGSTYLFMLKNNKIKVKSLRTNKKTITYVLEMKTINEKMIISYQIYDKRVFALGLLDYLKNKDESKIINLIG